MKIAHGNAPLFPILAALLLLYPLWATAQGGNTASLLPAEAVSRIAASGRAVRVGTEGLAFLPNHQAAAAMRAALVEEKPSILVEAVFSLPSPRPATVEARAEEMASIYGILRSLGSLQGIEYYSTSRKAMRTLYAESYIIDGPKTKVRLADPAEPEANAIPASETLYAFQRDLSFGSNLYRYDFSSFPDAVLVKDSNLTRMSYGVVPALSPNALSTRLLIVRADDAIIFYAENGAKAPSFLKGKLEDSFSARAEALFKWFSVKYSGLKQ